MTSYGYEAIDAAGKAVKGSIEADSMDKARADLKSQGLTVVALKEQSILTRDININIGGKPKARDLSVFCRQFVSMIRAGVTILDALHMLTEATENKKLQEAINEVRVSAEKVYESETGKFIEPCAGDIRGGAFADGQPECGF